MREVEDACTVEEEAEDVALPKARGNDPGLRNCIACDKEFQSEGWHNRLCPQCRKRSVVLG